MYVHIYVSMHLGYFISPTKSSLFPTQRMIHLGFGIDAQSSYFITDKYRKKFQTFRSELLSRGTASRRDLQRWLGKCCHLRLVFPAQSLFTLRCRLLLPLCGENDDARRPLPREAMDEIRFWSFVDTHTDPIPFLLQQHVSMRLFTDASKYGWGAKLDLPSGPSTLRDYWSSNLFNFDICTKEGLAVLLALQSVEDSLHRRRVVVYTDNEGLVHAWEGLKSRSLELTGVLQSLFGFCLDARVSLKLVWIPTDENPADHPSRVLDRADSALTPRLRHLLWHCFGPFHFDLMALPSNALLDPSGRCLPFFARFPVPSSAGTNVFAQSPPCAAGLYVFPPFALITPVINLHCEWGGVESTLVLPVFPGRPADWMHILRPFVRDELVLCPPASSGVLRFPTSAGFSENLLPVPYGLSAFRCAFPLKPRVARPIPPPSLKVLLFSDSMMRPLEALSWPSPFRVLTHVCRGATLEQVVQQSLPFAPSCDIFLLHAGVNDASKISVEFDAHFESACRRAFASVTASFDQRKVLVSTICLTKSDAVNLRVASANRILRDQARANGWPVVSNDNVRFSDLSDTVHLNAAGTARVFRNLLLGLRSI